MLLLTSLQAYMKLELLLQELFPRVAVCRGPLMPGHASAALRLLRRRRAARVIRATSFVILIGLRGARQGPHCVASGASPAQHNALRAGWGGTAPPRGRAMRDHGGRARRATASRSALAWRPASQLGSLGLDISAQRAPAARHLRPPAVSSQDTCEVPLRKGSPQKLNDTPTACSTHTRGRQPRAKPEKWRFLPYRPSQRPSESFGAQLTGCGRRPSWTDS